MVKEINVVNVSKWFRNGYWSAEMVDKAVEAGKITSEQAEKIKLIPVKTQA